MSNNDDFDNNSEFNGPSAGPDSHEFRDGPGILEAWNNSPALKMLTLGAGVVVLLVGYLIFSGGDEAISPSFVQRGSDVKEIPGAAVDPAYEEALKTADEQRLQEALQRNESVLPTPRGALVDRTGALFEADPEKKVEEEDPLERWRRQAEERELRRAESRDRNASFGGANAQRQQSPAGGQQQARDDVGPLAQAMVTQMQGILDARSQLEGAKVVTVTSAPEILSTSERLKREQGESEEVVTETIVIPAGEIYYAQLLTEANSSVNAPVLAQLHTGPLRGAKLLGRFQKTQVNKLILTFDKVVVDGLDHSIDAIAIDPATRNSGLATDVDYHLLARVILPGAAAFIEGLASAYAERENNVTVSGDVVIQQTDDLNTDGKIATGIEESAGEVGDFLDEEADRYNEPTITVAAGTPMGILFVSPVVSQE